MKTVSSPLPDVQSLIDRWQGNKRKLYIKGLLTGVLTGLIVVAYRLLLESASGLRLSAYHAMTGHAWAVLLWFAGLSACAAGVGVLITRYPMIRGSGIPQVKGVLLRQFHINWLIELVWKFFGGVAALACGLSLGREGPSIQLGSHVGAGIAAQSRYKKLEEKYLITAGASAGLAAAFNAPLAGVLFSLEELHKSFSPVMLSCLMLSSMAAEIVSKYFFGLNTVFNFSIGRFLPLSYYPVLIFLGILCGLIGALFNGALLKSMDLHERYISVSFLRPLPAFLTAGALGFLLPEVLGGGHELIIDSTLGQYGILMLILLAAVKLVFTALSYGSGSPGGIFFPLLVIGALLGRLYYDVLVVYFGFEQGFSVNFVVLGMTAFFTSVVRAPMTGSVLITEMTGSLSHLIALVVVSAVSYAVAEILKARPIYDAFLDRMMRKKRIMQDKAEGGGRKTILTVPVCLNSFLEHRLIGEAGLPQNCVLIGVTRCGRTLLPRADFRLEAGDSFSVLAEEADVTDLKPRLVQLGLAEDLV